jgi:AcrR family transcriptional regulator
VDTREALIAAAFKALEEEGEAKFSTRAVPTLYYHFGNADGLLSATLEEGFLQFLQRSACERPMSTVVLRSR